MKILKHLLYSFPLILSSLISFAQNWDSVSSGVTRKYFSWVSALDVYNGSLFVGGVFDSAGKIPANDIAQWNGTSWLAVGTGITGFYGVSSLIVYNGNLYAAGHFDSAGGILASNIAEWNGTNWLPLGSGITGGFQIDVECMAVYNGNLYIGGQFDTAGGVPSKNIAMWNGSTWFSVGMGTNEYGFIATLDSFKGYLYAGGQFDSIGNISASNIAQWDGTNWTSLGTGIGGLSGDIEVSSIVEYNGALIVCGNFDSAGGNLIYNLAQWNGTNWATMGNPSLSEISVLYVSNGILYASGSFDSICGIKASYIAQWNSSIWSAMGRGIRDISDTSWVNTICSYNGNIYAGGLFDSAGSLFVNNIAVWNLASGIQEIDNKNLFILFPNPNNGKFVIQSAVVSGQLSVEILSMPK